MSVDVRLVTAVFLLLGGPVLSQNRCVYLIEREPRPELPEQNFDGVPWSQRPLLPAEDRDDVCMEDFVPAGTLGTQVIYMEEEIEGNVTIAKFNYQGDAAPEIVGSFLSGTFNLLQPAITRIPEEGGEWHLVITQRQDYETPGMQQYMFRVRAGSEEVSPVVSIRIVNIDDNPPILYVMDPCQVDELLGPALADCTYEVYDADGEISIRAMTFRIESSGNDRDLFYVQGSRIENEMYRMHMTLGLNASLDFERNPLHIFTVRAFDSLPNNQSATMMVQVQNVEHRPPRWLDIFAVEQFNEKTNQSFIVRAIDGDTGIDRPIYYRLVTAEDDTFFHIETLEGGRSGANFTIDPIDRDELEREVFQLSIIAYKVNDAGVETYATAAEVVIIVNDVNDQFPRPFNDTYYISILEETPMTLNISNFGFHDRDLGQNAQYSLHLESEYPDDAHEAFYIAPTMGYQRQEFIMGTSNHSMLDYEVSAFQHIKLRVVAIDMNNPNLTGVAELYIDLINWNDEIPIFEFPTQTVIFNETEGEGYHVGRVHATDRDIDDEVVHHLLGNAGDYLSINSSSGDIYVLSNDTFDYHRQSQLFVQVMAIDTLGEPYNTATSQLVIELLDINNTPPTLSLPRRSPQVEENVPEYFEITAEISASDPDTTADLRFEIDWETSYATKQGRETPAIEYHNCVEIQTIYPNENITGSAIGRLVAKEIRHNVTIDYEEFEVLYLTVRVRDVATELGDDYDESTLTVTIIDMNDNAPLFANGTLEQSFRVREVSSSDVVIGSVLATDIDGPLYNQVRYSIQPRNETPANLVKIDFLTGQITVDEDGAIDADTPPRYNLYYTVIASDECSEENRTECPPDKTVWNTEGEITIQIIDTNNKEPTPDTDRFDAVVYIYENATTGDDVVILAASDLDRDEIYNTVSYQINYQINPRLRQFFAVELDTGRVYVELDNEPLDRDGDEPEHRIFFNLFDNFYGEGDGNRNQNTTEVLVVLLDVNDNAPEMPSPDELSWDVSENLQEGVRLPRDIFAPDRDEPDTDNSRVAYEILNLTLLNRDIQVPELFIMVNINNLTGELETAMPLRGYWGTYDIHIRAYDHGIPQQSSNETYSLVIHPYNYHAPVFVFPQPGSTVRLARERAVTNGLLATVGGEFIDRINATDEDGLEAGIVTFEITADADAIQYFQVANDGENLGSLILTQLFVESIREFQVTIRATDGGTDPNPLYSESTFNVVFVPTQGDPVFNETTATIAFIEGITGMSESHQLPLAHDLKNYLCEDDCYTIYYSIIGGNTDGLFGVNATNNMLYLEEELDRNQSASHVIIVGASNSPNGSTGLTGSTITVTVNVREADPRPVFQSTTYTAGISTEDSINRELLTVHAVHSEGATITYSIDWDTMVIDPSLEAVSGSSFVLHPSTGVLTLNMQPTVAMHGMFEFEVVATDPAGRTGQTEVKIYLISSLNRVTFIFVNTLSQVETYRSFIAQTFSVGFGMTCNIDQVTPGSDDSGAAVDERTEVRAHFIRDDIPVPAEEIERLRSDTVLLRTIQTTLATESINLLDFVTDISPETSIDSATITVYVLGALSAILAFLCLVLLISFLVKTRTLNRRLEALTIPKFGSMDSGLNRAFAPPGTNKHANAGSNPMWNETFNAPNFDTISDVSGDSDLIGIEDLPQFQNDYFPPDDDRLTRDGIQPSRDSVANHRNEFGFKPPPFNTEFTNNRFNK